VKTCTKCEQCLDETLFYASKSGKNGLSSWCKKCQRNQQREYHKRWYHENKERKLAESREWAKSHPEEIKIHQTAYRHAHPEYDLNKHSRRRNRMSASSFVVTRRDVFLMKQKPCLYCGAESSHIDHIVPLSRGGEHRIGNLAPACRACNLAKSNKFISEWRFA